MIHDFIYRIDNLFCIVWRSIRVKPPLSTEQFDKFIEFMLIISCFRFGSILLQDSDAESGHVQKLKKIK